ncbi:MAG: hypothetical protein IIV45_13810 [Lachnospiraceae bacterium]|nr:hypothetical protein [Lachnospiraceae bacterium]
MLYNFCVLIKNRKCFFCGCLAFVIAILPIFILIGHYGEASWYEEELLYFCLYQLVVPMVSGTAFVVFFQGLVDEKGREIFFVQKKMYLGEALLFLVAEEVVVIVSLMLSSIVSDVFEGGIVWVSIENIFLLGLLYLILFRTSSSVVAIGILVIVLLLGCMNILPFFPIFDSAIRGLDQDVRTGALYDGVIYHCLVPWWNGKSVLL